MAQVSTLRTLSKVVVYGTLTVSIVFAGFFFFTVFESEDAPIVSKHTEKPVRLLFVGDMMFDRHIREIANKYGGDYLFSCANETLKDYDAAIGNLEGPITRHESISLGSVINSPENYTFTFPLETAALLARHNISIVNIGNNHIYNFEADGISQTHEALDAARVGYFGGTKWSGGVYRQTIKGRPFSFVSFNEFGGSDATSTAAVIAAEKAANNTVVLYAHWGDEYVEAPARVRVWTKMFIDSGADVVIGSHPHVVQERGVYAGKPYYYSLGNFIFDQYFSEDVRHGLAVGVTFEGGVISTKEYRVRIERDGRSCIETSN